MSAGPAAPSGRRRLFVTTALPYANGPFHIGHIMEYIQADIWVRLQRMQGHEVHFVCADDTHGAAIMLKADAEGLDAGDARREDRRDAAEGPRRIPHQLRSLGLDRLAGEHRAVAGHLSPAARSGSLADHDEVGRAVLRPREADVPSGSLHQGRMPEVRDEGPVRRRLRVLRRPQRADRPQEPVFDGLRSNAGAQVVGSLLLSALRPRLRRIPARVDADAGTTAARSREQGARVAGR